MSSPDLQTVVIACPNCGTRYQVPYGTIGADGREVQCAQCSQSWHAVAETPPPPIPTRLPAAVGPPPEDALFSPAEESALDAAFEAEEQAVVPPGPLPGDIRSVLAPKPKKANINALDPALLSRSRRAFDLRQAKNLKKLPMARVRRTARLVAMGLLLGLLALGFGLRTELVRAFPSLAGLYAAIGLPVNVIGLTFEDSKTLTSFRNGKTVMLITSRIRSVATQKVSVPPVLVSLVDPAGATVYEWTVTPQATSMAPGEIFDFSTEISAPPQGATTVRLSFTPPRVGATSAATPAGTP